MKVNIKGNTMNDILAIKFKPVYLTVNSVKSKIKKNK